MCYTKPAVLSCYMATKSVMGVPKASNLADNIQGGSPTFLCSNAAYESDE